MRRSEALEATRMFPIRLGPWLRFIARRSSYRYLDESELRDRRRSDTVVVFGSGSSLNDLEPSDWDWIRQHDTFGFNWFVHERFVRCDFHLIRGIPDTDLDASVWRPQVEEYARLVRDNPFFANTVYLVHGGFRAINGNRAIGYGALPEGSYIFRWRTKLHGDFPTRSFRAGLVHGHSTLQECVNAAYLIGWKNIILAGVDLYDRRYFWLGSGETRTVDVRRGARAEDPHARAQSGLVTTLGRWRQWLECEGVELSVLNPKSLLASVLPVTSSHSR